MKFFIAGSTSPSASESSYARILREKGCEVCVWADKEASWLFGGRDWWQLSRPERVAYDAIASVRFYKACRQYKPDVLFMPKAENIHSYAVKRALEDTRARLVVWYPDNPFKADQTSMNILRNLKRCDLFYIWGKFLIDSLRAVGCRRVDYLPFGFDPVLHPAIEPTPAERATYRCDVCFVGTWDEERQLALEPLAEFNLGIWGPFWADKVSSGSPLAKRIRGAGLYGDEMVKAFKSAKIVFNHLRLHNGSAHNMRTMEITGIGGGTMLVRRTAEQSRELFVEGEHIMCFENCNEMQSAVSTLLNTPNSTSTMAYLARQRAIAEHLVSFRLDRILHDLS
jgi:spore maturation protein CgeB